MIDDDVGHGLHTFLQQRFQHGPMLLKVAVAIVQVEIFLWIVAGTVLAGVRRGRQPDQIEPAIADLSSLFFDHSVPFFCTEQPETALDQPWR